jgi:hypothetical protein
MVRFWTGLYHRPFNVAVEVSLTFFSGPRSSTVPAIMMRIGRVLAVVALLNFAGAHWVVLQSIAWSGMLAKQARYSRLAEAIQKTFDGAHPCNLCKGISRAQGKERKPPVPVQIHKLPFLQTSTGMAVVVSQFSIALMETTAPIPLRSLRPDYPPPRAALS